MHAAPALTVGLALLVAACAAPEAGTPAPTPAPVTTSARPTPTPTPTPVPTTPPRTAADGTDLSACADGKCEMRVDGPADIPVPPPLRAVRVEQEGAVMRLVVLGPDGFRAGGSGGGTVTLAESAVVTFEDIGGGSMIVAIDA